MRVLVVDDDPGFLRYAALALEEAQIEYVAVPDARAAWDTLAQHSAGHFDVILLDVEMPGIDGWDFLKELRARDIQVPVIFVTGHDAVEQRIKGLRLGADDYIIKPFEFEELVARLEAVLRRHASAQIEVGDIKLNLAHRRLERAGEEIELSPREFELLLALALARGRVLSRKELLREVWRLEFEPGTNVLDVHMTRLRKKLGRRGGSPIETVRGQGYRLVAD
jgi:two-component system OmpR family response regulator